MTKQFKELKNGEKFRIIGEVKEVSFTGKKPGPDVVLAKIPFMRNFYNTTGNKRNAKVVQTTHRVNDKFYFIGDSQPVEPVKE